MNLELENFLIKDIANIVIDYMTISQEQAKQKFTECLCYNNYLFEHTYVEDSAERAYERMELEYERRRDEQDEEAYRIYNGNPTDAEVDEMYKHEAENRQNDHVLLSNRVATHGIPYYYCPYCNCYIKNKYMHFGTKKHHININNY
jgi:hypothetical protein